MVLLTWSSKQSPSNHQFPCQFQFSSWHWGNICLQKALLSQTSVSLWPIVFNRAKWKRLQTQTVYMPSCTSLAAFTQTSVSTLLFHLCVFIVAYVVFLSQFKMFGNSVSWDEGTGHCVLYAGHVVALELLAKLASYSLVKIFKGFAVWHPLYICCKLPPFSALKLHWPLWDTGMVQ